MYYEKNASASSLFLAFFYLFGQQLESGTGEGCAKVDDDDKFGYKSCQKHINIIKKKPVSTASLASTPGTAGGCTAAAGPACARGTAPEIRQPLLNPF